MDVKKIIKGLECCTSGRGKDCCIGCPYIYPPQGASPDYDGCEELLKDALSVLKELEHERPRA